MINSFEKNYIFEKSKNEGNCKEIVDKLGFDKWSSILDIDVRENEQGVFVSIIVKPPQRDKCEFSIDFIRGRIKSRLFYPEPSLKFRNELRDNVGVKIAHLLEWVIHEIIKSLFSYDQNNPWIEMEKHFEFRKGFYDSIAGIDILSEPIDLSCVEKDYDNDDLYNVFSYYTRYKYF
jgi:hypothetical protein